ncbi:MAG TPA: antibiotic biosynthesis monooxygenase [Acidimicrobiia bacterium]|jgi:quinol monooxygenase YgiN
MLATGREPRIQMRQQPIDTTCDHHRWTPHDGGDRSGFVDAHRDLVERARASHGCIHLAITADSVDPRRVNNVEVWTASDALEAWRARANAPHTGIAIEDPAMARYEAVDGGPLFP